MNLSDLQTFICVTTKHNNKKFQIFHDTLLLVKIYITTFTYAIKKLCDIVLQNERWYILYYKNQGIYWQKLLTVFYVIDNFQWITDGVSISSMYY